MTEGASLHKTNVKSLGEPSGEKNILGRIGASKAPAVLFAQTKAIDRQTM